MKTAFFTADLFYPRLIFLEQGLSLFSSLYYKCFTIVIYDRNDCGQYYKPTIIIKASLASLSWIINYSHSLCSKLKLSLIHI